jgi:hypothetical protein
VLAISITANDTIFGYIADLSHDPPVAQLAVGLLAIYRAY